MKILLSILVFFIFSFPCFSQHDKSTSILEDAVRNLKEPNSIIYIDSAMNYYGLIGNVSKKGNINGYLDTTKVILHFQKNEIHFLSKEFKKDTSFAWRANMFNNSVMTTFDSANYYRLKLMKEQTGKKDKRYFYFSRIIFFDNVVKNSW